MKAVYLIALACSLGLFGSMYLAGHHNGYNAGAADTQAAADKKVDAAKADTRQANAERDATRQTLANVQHALASARTQLAAQHAVVEQALADNTALKARLATRAGQRHQHTVEVGHADPTCADLARLPVCPAVARRLWGPSAVRPAAASH